MELMTVEKFSSLLLKYGVRSTDENIFEVMRRLDACHQVQEFELQYGLLINLAAGIRQCMLDLDYPEGWQAEIMEHLKAYVLSGMEQNQRPVPSEIHFVWIGSAIPQVVMDYVKLWAKMNPDYNITIWYDSNLLCLKKLSDCFKRKAEERFQRAYYEAEWANEVFQLRQQFTDFVRNNTEDFAGMTAMMNAFMVQMGFVEQFLNDPVWTWGEGEREMAERIRFRNLYEEGLLRPLYMEYMMEAVQTQNFAALSDMARLLVLKQYGGIYIDVDMMPEIKKGLSDKFVKGNRAMQRVMIQAIMEATGEITGYRTDELEQCDKKAQIRAAIGGKSLQELMEPLGTITCHPMAFRAFDNLGIINQMVVASKDSMMIDYLLQQIKDNYETMNTFFLQPPFGGRRLQDVTEERESAPQRAVSRRQQAFLVYCIGYYETGLLKGGESTIYLTGPSVYRSMIQDIIMLYFDTCTNVNNSSRFPCFIIENHKLSTQTEEELHSSWVVR